MSPLKFKLNLFKGSQLSECKIIQKILSKTSLITLFKPYFLDIFFGWGKGGWGVKSSWIVKMVYVRFTEKRFMEKLLSDSVLLHCHCMIYMQIKSTIRHYLLYMCGFVIHYSVWLALEKPEYVWYTFSRLCCSRAVLSASVSVSWWSAVNCL